MAKLTVLGIGNILMRDEGVGVRLVEAVQRVRDWPADVEFIDGGVGGLGLLSIIEQAQRLIVLDAADMGLPPGEGRVVQPEQVETDQAGMLSLHELPFVQTLQLCSPRPAEVRILAIQPGVIESGLTLSSAVESQMDALTRQAVGLIQQWLGE